MEGFTLQSSKKHSIKEDNHQKKRVFGATPFEILSRMEERINPAIILAEELMRKGLTGGFDFDDFERAEQTLEISRTEINRVDRQLKAIIKTSPIPTSKIPAGF